MAQQGETRDRPGETLATLTAHIWSGRGVAMSLQPVSSGSRLRVQEVSHADGNVTSELQQLNREQGSNMCWATTITPDTSAQRQPRHTEPADRTRFHGQYRCAPGRDASRSELVFEIFRVIKVFHLLLFHAIGFPGGERKKKG